jgi:beta-phosphoglucomutase family hydrolase
MPSPSAVIFDMDGVLVDTEPLHIEVNLSLLAELGINFPKERILEYVGISAPRFWQEIKQEFDLPQSAEELIATERARLLAHIAKVKAIPPIPGIRELLDELSARNVPLAVASSSAMEAIIALLTKSDVLDFFPVLVSGQDLSRGKPAPDIFLLAAEKLGARPDDCLVIEDSSPGVAGAKAAGMQCVGFVNKNSGNQDLSRADLIVADFSEMNREKIGSLLKGFIPGGDIFA